MNLMAPLADLSNGPLPERVLIVDDHSLVRDGLRSVLAVSFEGCDILEAANFCEARAILDSAEDIDLVLLDLNMPDVTRFSALQALRESHPATPVVMVSGVMDRVTIHDALAAGAAGFVPKSLKRADIVEALRHVMAGEIYVPEVFEADDENAREEASIRERIDSLTPQQRVVLRHLVDGKLNKQIAYELDVSMTTVKAHVSAILQKLNVFSRTQAVILANRIGFSG